MMKLIINPITPFICFALALIFFRKDRVSLGSALFFFIRRSALIFDTKMKDIFTAGGIYLFILGLALAVAYVLDISAF
jgi:hypothetical protein